MELLEANEFTQIIPEIIQRSTAQEAFGWMQEKAVAIRQEKGSNQLYLAFAAVPGKTGRQLVKLSDEEKETIKAVHPDFLIDDWTIDRLSRVWLSLQINCSEKDNYCYKIQNLFKAAEMNELAALYSSLFFFAYPEEWRKQCAEGIRSNIGTVLEAIMYNNPYPAKNLDDLAWNQLVLKAFFTEKDVNRIIGLDERANKELAMILIDYANERWVAHRTVNPQLWRLVSPSIDESNIENIEKALKSIDFRERQGAALACFQSTYPPTKHLLNSEPDLKSAIFANKLNWNTL